MMKKIFMRSFNLLLALLLLISALSVGIVPVAAAETKAEDGIAPVADSNATYAPESAHIWTNKTLAEGDEMGQYSLSLEAWVDNANLILEENIPLDVVFCIDQSASMYRPAHATDDLRCDSSFGASRTQTNSTSAQIAATGEIPRAEFINKMETDLEFAERATHYGYYIGRSAGHKKSPGAWFIIRYDAATEKFHGYRTCRTNHPSHTTGTYTCPDPTGDYGNHGVSSYITWDSVDKIPEEIGRFYVTQYGMMYEAVLAFVEAAKANAEKNGVNHRFAFTTFSGIGGSDENGTSIIIGNQRTTYEDFSQLDDAGKYSSCNSAMLSALDDAEWNQILQSVNTIKSDYSGTHTQAGMRLAKEILNQTKDDPETEGRKRFILLFTDGEPNMYFTPTDGSTLTFANETEKTIYCKNKVISEAFKVKKSREADDPGLGAQIYTICTSGDEDGDFLKFVSSSYPAAVDMTNTGAYSGRVFYYLENNAAGIDSVFAEIRDKELLDRSFLGENIIMRDVISSDFYITSDNVTAHMVPYIGSDAFNEDPSTWVPLDVQTELDVDIQRNVEEYGGNDVIEVTGFDYAAHCIKDGATPSGYKLVVQVEISAEDVWAGKKAAATNDTPNSGIYGEEGKIIGFATPTTDLPTHIYLKKTVAGEQANPDDTFGFTVTARKQTRNASGFYYTVISRTESDNGTGNVLVTRGGNHLQANIEEITDDTVKLKHEEIHEIDLLEAGSTVSVQEHTKPGYTATVKIEYADGTEEVVPPEDYASGTLTVPVVPGMTIHYINFAYPRPDTVVMDYGIPMNVYVLVNDLTCATGKLEGVGALKADLSPTTSKASGYDTSYTGKYGKLTVKDNYLIYTPSSMKMSEPDVVTYVVSQTVDGTLYYFYSTLTVVPATSIYYESNDFVSFSSMGWSSVGTAQTKTQGEDRPGQFEFAANDKNNAYGYDPAYDGSTTYSLGTAYKVNVDANTYKNNGNAWPTATFTFTGTGFDLVSLTSNKSGFITCDVYSGTEVNEDAKAYSWVVDTYYGYGRQLNTKSPWIEYCYTYSSSQKRWIVTETAVAEPTHNEVTQTPSNPKDGDKVYQYRPNYQWTAVTSGDNDLYQIPVIRYTDLEHGTYTVVVTPTYIPLFDHNPSASGYDFYLDAVRVYGPAQNMESYYVQDGEAYPQYIELRKLLLATDSDGNTTGYVNGISYIDGVTSNGAAADYDEYGPNNEIYLSPNRAIAFAIDSNGGKIADVQVGVKTFGETATLVASAVDADGKNLSTQNISTGSHTDRYYSIRSAYAPVSGSEVSNVIVLTNTGDKPITLTTMKITYEEAPTGSAELVMDTAKMEAVKRHVAIRITPPPAETLTDEGLTFFHHSLSLQSNTSMNFMVDSSVLANYDSLYVEFERYDYEKQTVVTETAEGSEFAGQWLFSYGLDSNQMTDLLSATLYGVKDGVVYKGETRTDSVEQYILSRLSQTDDEKLLRLYADLLTYGAKAQIYMEYRLDALADAGLGEYAAYVTAEDPEADHFEGKTSYGYTGSELIQIALGISSEIRLQMLVTLNGYAAEDVYAVMRFDRDGVTVTERVDGVEFEPVGEYYLMIFDSLTAVDGRTPVEVTVYQADGEAIGETWTYSISTYYTVRNSGTAGETMRALLNYLDAAAVYFGS